MRFFSPKVWVGAVAALVLGIAAQPAKAGFETYGFSNQLTNNDTSVSSFSPAAAFVTLYDGTDAVAHGGSAGSVVFTVSINLSASFNGDLFAFYGNTDLNLTAPTDFKYLSGTPTGAGSPISSVVDANNVQQVVDKSTNIKPLGGFDFGVQFASQGAQVNAVSVTFQIWQNGNTFSIDDFANQFASSTVGQTDLSVRFGLRAQNTSGGNLGSSWKLFNGQGDTPIDQGPLPGPAPGGLVLVASMLPFGLLLRRKLSRREVAA